MIIWAIQHFLILGLVFLTAWLFDKYARDKLGIKRSTIYWVVLIGLAVLLAALIAPFLLFWIAVPFLGDAASELSFALGTGGYARSAIFAALLAGTYLLWRSWRKHRAARPLLIVTGLILAAAYFASLSFITGDFRFTRGGDPAQCFIVFDDHVAYRTISYEGIDPVSGRSCRAISPDQIQAVERLDQLLRSGASFDPLTEPSPTWFSPTSGVPLHWYERDGLGRIWIYSVPGYSPMNGTELEPVSTEIIAEWLDQYELQVQDQQAAAAARLAQEAAAAEQERLERDERLRVQAAEQQRLEIEEARDWWAGPAGAVSLVQMIDLTGNACGDVRNAIIESARARACSVALDPLRNGFGFTDVGNRALDGHVDRLAVIPEFARARVTFLEVECNCQNAQSNDQRSCELSGAITTFDSGAPESVRHRIVERYAAPSDRVISSVLPTLFADQLMEELSCGASLSE